MGSAVTTVKSYFGIGAAHVIHVRTGDRKGAGTDANVWIIIRDEHGVASEERKLNHWFKNDNEKGCISSFHVSNLEHMGRIVEIELWRDSFGVGHAWFVDKIEVENRILNARHCFPIQRWIKPYVHYVLKEFDSFLPHNDSNQEQREEELRERKEMYQYEVNVPGGPAQIKSLPEDETFTGEYIWELLSHKSLLMVTAKFIHWTTDNWKTLDDFKKVYGSDWTTIKLPEPHTLEYWQEDHWFGLQRVQGCNPVLIRLCTEIPEKFGVTDEMVAPFMEELTIQQAIEKNRLFIVDLKMVNELPCKAGLTICSPLALFFLNKDQDLMPVAIQLFQDKGPDNPVFTPSDPYYTWLLAKMYYNNADATYHQAYTHLGFTHLIMEGVAVCTNRNFSPSHPLYRLLAPHFLFLLAINTRGLDKLVSPGGWVDRTMTCGREGMFELIRRGLSHWGLNFNGNIPNEIKSRGVMSSEILPHYPYRDDAVAIYNAIRNYISKVVNHHYADPSNILKDEELQNWRRELVLSRDEGGVGLLGVLGDPNGGFTTTNDVIDTVTSIISVCSLGHAAANFQQYDEYGFPPNYPPYLSGDVLSSKDELSEADIVKRLPDKENTLDTMVITKLLSSKGTKSLGDFEVQYLYHPVDIQAAEEFRAELKGISANISSKNYDRKRPYLYLDPQFVPNAISI